MQRCFLDVDGVLADFTMGAHRKLRLDLDYSQWPYPKGPDGWNWHRVLGMTYKQLSDVCDFELWASLPWCSDGRDILRVVLEFFDVEQITLLTAPMPNVMSASGKMAWIEKNLPEYRKRVGVWSDSKAILATVPGSVLIDDNQGNCEAWHAAGGDAVLIPRPWNNLHADYFNSSLSMPLALKFVLRSLHE